MQAISRLLSDFCLMWTEEPYVPWCPMFALNTNYYNNNIIIIKVRSNLKYLNQEIVKEQMMQQTRCRPMLHYATICNTYLQIKATITKKNKWQLIRRVLL